MTPRHCRSKQARARFRSTASFNCSAATTCRPTEVCTPASRDRGPSSSANCMPPKPDAPPGHHQRWTSSGKDAEAEDQDWIDPQVDQQGCGKVYAELEECLGENDRDWRRCQAEVQKLKECYQKAVPASKQ